MSAKIYINGKLVGVVKRFDAKTPIPDEEVYELPAHPEIVTYVDQGEVEMGPATVRGDLDFMDEEEEE